MASSAPQWKIPLSQPDFDDEEAAAVGAVLASRWLSMGPEVAAFEAEFSQWLDADHPPHAVAVANATAALHLALLALGIGPGDEVIQPSLSFVAMANVTRLVGAMPVFCDIVGPHQPVACPRHAESLITPRTRALVVMAYGGMPPDMAAWSQLAHRHGLALIEDACHGLGAQWCGRNLGLFGHVAAFSFFANKNLVTGEGGMAVTGDAQLAARLRLLRSHGMSSLTHERHHRLASTYDVTLHGMNVRLDEIRAALGRVQLRKLAAGNARRSDRLREYAVALESGPVTLPDAWSLESLCGNQRHGCHLMPVLVPPQAFWIDLARHLNHQGIQTSHHYPPVHQFTAFAPASAAVPFLPCTDDFAARQVTLPLWAGLTSDEVVQVASAVKAWPSA